MTQEKFKTYNGVFDEFTKISIEVLKKRDYFEELIRPIKCGKEADVYLAKYKNGFRAVKIYRINCIIMHASSHAHKTHLRKCGSND